MFYERLKELRNEKKISQTKLAQDMGVSSATVSMWEIDLRMPSIDLAIKLSEYFGVSLDYLFCDAPMRERIPVDEHGFKIKTPPELESVGVENVVKAGGGDLTPDEVAAIRRMLSEQSKD